MTRRPSDGSAIGQPAFAPGFRCSRADLAILLTALGAAALLWPSAPTASLAIAYVLGHFFLFCNVFRVRRGPELAWAGAVVALAAASRVAGWPGLAGVAVAGSVLAAALIARETRQPLYHGVRWRRWNPRLPNAWEHHVDQPVVGRRGEAHAEPGRAAASGAERASK